ncbi:MAG: SLC13 family permease [Lachnospiraceae bacterium]|jgi:sodium-dependent dicarboxylate transporter 2/3/5
MSQAYIVLIIMAIMAVMFLSNKFKMGVVAMTACVLLVVTGVLTPAEAFSGFANNTVILVAPMMVLSMALMKTHAVKSIRTFLGKQKGKKGLVLVSSFALASALFASFMPLTAAVPIIYTFLQGLDDENGDYTAFRLLLPMTGIMEIWKWFLPVSQGASNFATINAFYEGIIPDEQYQLTILDPFKVMVLPVIVITLFCIFCFRLMPKKKNEVEIGLGEMTSDDVEISKFQENVIYVCFIGTMLCMLLNQWTGRFMWIAPAISVLVLLYLRIITVEETVRGLCSDLTFMLAGVLTMATAMGVSGAGELIGSWLMNIIGTDMSSFMIILIFTTVSVVMTTFMANAGCQAVLIPVAASIALTAGWDPRGLAIAITFGCNLAIAFPSGSGEGAVMYSIAGYSPVRCLRFTLPYIIIAIFVLSLSTNYFFPVY